MTNNDYKDLKLATFAGGCFWCMVQPFEKLDGVYKVISGYIGGNKENPTYEDVCKGNSGHYEAVQIIYDPSKITYDTLLNVFWRQIDPVDPGGQFYDRGSQYKTAIFYHDEEQRTLARESKARLEGMGKFDKPVATSILKASIFYPAEEYHQDYHAKNPGHYKGYRLATGRDKYIERIWGQ